MNLSTAQLRKAINVRTHIDKIESRICRLKKQLESILRRKTMKAFSAKKQQTKADSKPLAVTKPKTGMYPKAKTWNPFKGCLFDCSYCGPSFQQQAKRQKQNCMKCYKYTPHFHPHQLSKIPSKPIVFACGSGDVAFCKPKDMLKIIDAITNHRPKKIKNKVFYLQSKKPSCLKPFLGLLPENVILVTTLETNRDKGYDKISKAPVPSKRYRQFLALKYPRKVVTIEPVMNFDVKTFAKWILKIKPEYVWLGFNSKNKSVSLPEPSIEKVQRFIKILHEHNIEIRGKTLRGIKLP